MGRMVEYVTIDFDRPIPVFPLPGTVLLPHNVMPLHIFEPRYRQMVNDSLNSAGLLAMALFGASVDEEQYLLGRPPLRPAACVGHISHYEPQADGRFIVLLAGVCRANLVEEVPHEPYRTFLLRPVDIALKDDQDDDAALAEWREKLLDVARDPALDGIAPQAVLREEDGEEAPVSTRALIDMLLDASCGDPEDRYRMLEEPAPARRAAWLLERLQSMRRGGGD